MLDTCLCDFDDLPEDVHAFGEMCSEGDIKHTWNPKDPEKVREAQLMFDAMVAKGFRAFHLKKGQPGEMMTSFDPKAKKVLFVPPMAGGLPVYRALLSVETVPG